MAELAGLRGEPFIIRSLCLASVKAQKAVHP